MRGSRPIPAARPKTICRVTVAAGGRTAHRVWGDGAPARCGRLERSSGMGSGIFPLAFLLSVVAGVAPTLLCVLLVWRIDRYEKEPIRLLTVAFLWGAAPAVVLSAVLELAFDEPILIVSRGYHDLISMGLVTPVVEEMVKGLALLGLFCLARSEFDGVLDGIIYGAVVGLGFAMTENVLYFLGAWRQGGVQEWGLVVLTRALAFGLNHAMYTALTGLGFGLARYARSWVRRNLFVLLGLLGAMLAHSLHNSFLSLGTACFASLFADWLGVLVIVVIVALAWRRDRLRIETQLAEEVSFGVLTPTQFETIASRRRRLGRELELVGVSDARQARMWRKLVAAATELAFKKHQRAAMAEESGNCESIVALRTKIAQIRRSLGDEALQEKLICSRCGRPSPTNGGASCPRCGAGWPAKEN